MNKKKNSGDMCKLRVLTNHKRDYCKGSERVSDRKTGGWFVWLQMGSTVHGQRGRHRRCL